MSRQASVIVTTFNHGDRFDLTLAGLARQSAIGPVDFEVVFADDGSDDGTLERLQSFLENSPFPATLVRQEHLGFRKCRLLNEALRQTTGEWIIFMDGDVIPHREFVWDHLRWMEPDRLLIGRRIDLGPELSAALTPEAIRRGHLDGLSLRLLASSLRRDSKKVGRALRVLWPPMRRLMNLDTISELRGCNYSVAREHLVAVNGFDEAYEGYGGEDTDVELRLFHLGLKPKSIKGLALQCHIWHPQRLGCPANDELLEAVRNSDRVWCERGLEQADRATAR